MNEANSKDLELLEEFAARLIKYYQTLKGSTTGYQVAFHIKEIKKEMESQWKTENEC